MKPAYLTFSDLGTVLKKRVLLILLIALLCAVLCFSVRALLPVRYSATATFYVRNLQSEAFLEANGLTSSQLAVVSTLAKEYAGVAINGDGLLDAVIAAHLPELSRETLREMLTSAPDGTSFTVTATGKDAALVDRLIAAVETELPAYIQKTAWPQLPKDHTVVVLLREAQAASIVTPHPLAAAAMGGVLGFLLSYLFFIFCFLFSDRLDDAGAIDRALPQTPLLGVIPEIPQEGDAAEFFYALRERLPRGGEGKALTLAVTSTGAGEGKSYVLAGIAKSFAVAGKRVLVIDADLRRGAKGQFFQPDAAAGFSDYLKDPTIVPAKLIRETKVGPFVLPVGQVPISPCDVPFSERVARLIAELSPQYDCILTDFPAVTEAPEAASCAADFAATLMVAAPGRCGARGLRAALSTLEDAGANVIGAAANILPRSSKKSS